MTDRNPAEAAAAALDGLAGDLAAAYPRAAHRGRIEQIAAHAAGLAALLRELPAEEDREADLEDRLMASYRAGGWKGAGADHAVTHTDRAQVVLADVLERQGQS